MSEQSGIKGHLLRQAVRSNVDVVKGKVRFRRPTPVDRAGKLGRIFFLWAVPMGFFASSYLVSGAAEGWIENRRSHERALVKQLEVEVAEAQAVAADAQAATADARAAVADAQAEAQTQREAARAAVLSARATTPPTPGSLSAPLAIDRAVFPLAVRKVVIDPGHGGDNTGAKSPHGLVEKTMALDISQRLVGLLEEAEYEVETTRTSDEFVSLEDRANLANERGGDIFVSVHLNWIEERDIRGVETYFLGATDDPYLTRLAAEENRDSGYSLADFRTMLDRVYAGARQGESERLALAVQDELYNYLRKVNPQLQDRGVKRAPFIVLTGTEMPAILAEVSCLSNDKEARLLMSPGYRQYIAEALFSGIEFYARSMNGMNQRGS